MNIEFSINQWKEQYRKTVGEKTIWRDMPGFVEQANDEWKRTVFFPELLLHTLSSDHFPGTLSQIEYYTTEAFPYSMHLDKVIIDFTIGAFAFKSLVQMTHHDKRLFIGWHRPSPHVPLPDGVGLIAEAVVEFLSENSPNRLHITANSYSKEEVLIAL